jgi:outer membrane protein
MKFVNIYNLLKLSFLLNLCCVSQFTIAQNTLKIDDAIRIALNKNYDIQIAAKDAQVSVVNNTPGNAGMLPTVGIVGSGNYTLNNTTQKLVDGTENSYPNSTNSSLSLGVQLNWTIFDGGKMFVTKSKLNEIQSLGEIQFKDNVLRSMFSVIAAYYDVVRQKQQLNFTNEVLNYNQNRLEVAQAKYNAGSLIKSDLLQAKIDLNVSTENKINQEFTLKESLKTLNLALGQNSEEPIAVNDNIPLDFKPNKDDLISKLNKTNTSILSIQKQLDIAELVLKENRSLYLPNLSVKGGYYLSQSANSNGTILNSNNTGPQIGGSLSIPIYSAGETNRKVKVAKIQQESIELNLQSTKLQVNTLLMNTFTDFENQEQLLKIETENNGLAKENMLISLERLKQGETTSTEVHLAEENYAQSSTRLVNFRYNLKMAETRIKQLVSSLGNM